MTLTLLNDLSAQITERWAPSFMKSLRERHKLFSLINRDYEGEITSDGTGNMVKISVIDDIEGERKAIDASGAHTVFTPEKVVTRQIELVANQRISASFEIDDLVKLQNQLAKGDSELKDKLEFACARKLNDYLYSLVAPSISAPDHLITAANLTATQLIEAGVLAAQSFWGEDKPWYCFADPVYYGDLLAAQTLTSSDYVGVDQPVVSGEINNKRFGWNILRDSSRGLAQISPTNAATKNALFFHPDFMVMAMQYQPRFLLSNQHALGRFTNIMSVDFVVGAKLGIDGDKKHITYSAA